MPPKVIVPIRRIVIDAELKTAVDAILRAPTATDSSVKVARRDILALTTDRSPYLCAIEIRSYLEEKIKSGTESRAFTIAGDLFLDALEANLATAGPRFLEDHYNGFAGCYRLGDDAGARLQAPLNGLDLIFQRTLLLFVQPDDAVADKPALPLSFEMPEAQDRASKRDGFLRIAQRCLDDTVEAVMKADRAAVDRELLDYVVDAKAAAENALKRWSKHLKSWKGPVPWDKSALHAALELAEESGYMPFVAVVMQILGQTTHDEGDSHDAAVQLYGAGDMFLLQANHDRDHGAYYWARRRYACAIALFNTIRDRTTAAKALVEQARAYIRKGDVGEEVRQCLHKAVCLVVAHKRNLAAGQTQELGSSEVLRFLEQKGYETEAQVLRGILGL